MGVHMLTQKIKSLTKATNQLEGKNGIKIIQNRLGHTSHGLSNWYGVCANRHF